VAGTGNVLKLLQWRTSSRPYLKEINKIKELLKEN